MFFKKLPLVAAIIIAFAGFTAVPAQAISCVEFVHKVSSFKLSGNAWQWWKAAAGRYARGNDPEQSAVLVFDRSGKMRLGHVAVVSQVLDPRTIEIDHANWSVGRIGKGKVFHNMRVVDVSPRNDWTMVRVWNDVVHDFGRPYKAMGFIYAP